MAERCILTVKFSQAAAGRVGGFLRYVQYRDHHQDAATAKETSGLLRYVSYRDRTSVRGQLFGPKGIAGDQERKELLAHVARSTRTGERSARRPARTVYRFVLSPERAEGLDLRELARATMGQLERDAGPLPPWLAAIHRNTTHPHVHIVMAARREVVEGRFEGLVITKPRLARMKESLSHELRRQRGERIPARERGPNRSRPAHRHSSGRRSYSWLTRGVSAFRRLTWLYQRRMELELERYLKERERELSTDRGRERG